ncbi:hypothetical protein GCM10007939_16170 [Amylibacter marinus]|uniref:DUF3299 domain-containing protein n=1 Tax=Amylibacter marinus TaxID=1475483 RepID=A0ABQ5VVK9_9RHOB|nr:DUF3299 domain-containing protein [Amylibacter marinus]GLQ35334.1 hypothetical protein GCM10007939_16170 [Amylibacter marinus]
MVGPRLARRWLLAGMAASALVTRRVHADEFIDLDWDDLLPEGESIIPNDLLNLIDHDKSLPSSEQPISSGVRTDWTGQTVRLPGFVVPIEHRGTGVTAFILVPYVGACVHVPPPPANQLVFVTTETPFETKGLYEPVNVIGMFGVSSIYTHLAEVGYAISADRIEPYNG